MSEILKPQAAIAGTPYEYITIAQIVRLGFSRVYVHRAFVKGWLQGKKVAMPTNPRVLQWVCTKAQYKEWRQRCDQHSNRGTFSGTARQIESLQEYLKSAKAEDVAALRKSIEGDIK